LLTRRLSKKRELHAGYQHGIIMVYEDLVRSRTKQERNQASPTSTNLRKAGNKLFGDIIRRQKRQLLLAACVSHYISNTANVLCQSCWLSDPARTKIHKVPTLCLLLSVETDGYGPRGPTIDVREAAIRTDTKAQGLQ